MACVERTAPRPHHPSARRAVGPAVMGLLVDVTPLRVSRDFRRLWAGQGVSAIGNMITSAALPYQVFHETGSTLAVGLLGIVQLVPLLTCSLVGGALADSVD